MSLTHTPGPWEAEELKPSHARDPYPYAIWKDGLRLALVERRPLHAAQETLANARLIAAAPELLEAAKQVVAYAQEHGGPNDYHALIVLDAAIAKAEGRD